jgi:hypothetical protein
MVGANRADLWPARFDGGRMETSSVTARDGDLLYLLYLPPAFLK